MHAALAFAVSGLLFTPFNSATAAQNRVSAKGAETRAEALQIAEAFALEHKADQIIDQT